MHQLQENLSLLSEIQVILREKQQQNGNESTGDEISSNNSFVGASKLFKNEEKVKSKVQRKVSEGDGRSYE